MERRRHIDAAREAIAHLAALAVTVERAAEALIATADATMARLRRGRSNVRPATRLDRVVVAVLACCGLAERLGMTSSSRRTRAS
jgi:hypothetical protein